MSARVTLILINEEYQIMTEICIQGPDSAGFGCEKHRRIIRGNGRAAYGIGDMCTGDFLESIKEREKEYPTDLPIEPYAVAIPHTDPGCIKNALLPVSACKEPIPWREMAANEVVHMVRFVFLLGFKQVGGGGCPCGTAFRYW